LEADSLAQCTGDRLVCARCKGKGRPCEYELTRDVLTRAKELQDKLNPAKQELKLRLRDLTVAMNVIWQLQSGSDYEAAGILARVRLGYSLEAIAGGTFTEEVR